MSRQPDAQIAIDAEANRTLSPEEVRKYLETPLSEDERNQVLDLVRWFRRRYPTGAERLAYARKAYARWTRRPSLMERINERQSVDHGTPNS